MFSIINNLIIINFEFTPDPTPLRILQFMLGMIFFLSITFEFRSLTTYLYTISTEIYSK